jgi:hypothetical protein
VPFVGQASSDIGIIDSTHTNIQQGQNEMSESDRAFAGSIPGIYDAHLVPLIFEAFADDLAERVVAFDPAEILETAAGSGVIARALTSRLSPEARYTVTDLNQPMLDHAAASTSRPPVFAGGKLTL